MIQTMDNLVVFVLMVCAAIGSIVIVRGPSAPRPDPVVLRRTRGRTQTSSRGRSRIG